MSDGLVSFVNPATGESVTLVTRDGTLVLRGTPQEMQRGVETLFAFRDATGGALTMVERVDDGGGRTVGFVKDLALLFGTGEVEVRLSFVPAAPPPRPRPEST